MGKSQPTVTCFSKHLQNKLQTHIFYIYFKQLLSFLNPTQLQLCVRSLVLRRTETIPPVFPVHLQAFTSAIGGRDERVICFPSLNSSSEPLRFLPNCINSHEFSTFKSINQNTVVPAHQYDQHMLKENL